MKTELRIEGMNCQHCVKAVQRVLSELPNLQALEVSIGYAVVTTEVPPDLEQIQSALDEEGFRLVS